ncbi:FtsK/SpoIIIE domain-containing protein [Streptomyces sp. NPDC051644]|uniref:FtsK/SpoIIIE domain-containing protein n=1 Tax=Streptomyces sp. NPDC051644 TaxID=3365666 RepID=UPI0037A50008
MAQPSTTVETAERSPVIAPVAYGVGIAMISYAASSMLNAEAIFLPYGLTAAALVAVLGALIGTTTQRRARPVRDLTNALAGVLRPEKITARRRVRGIPTWLAITYPPDFNDRDEKLRADVRAIIATRLGAPVSATWRRNKRQLLCDIDATALLGDIVESDTPAAVATDDNSPEQTRLRGRTTSVVHAIMGPSASVADVDFDGDTPTRVEVSYPTTSRDLSAGYRSRVVLQLDAKLPGSWRDTWHFEQDRVTFELRPPFPTNVRYPFMHKAETNSLLYAVTEYNSIVCWKLGSKNPHCLVVGPTGSGKTVFIRNLVVGARVLGIPVVLCDPKMTEYLDFQDLDGVTVLTEAEHIAMAIRRTHDEMMNRYDAIKRRQAQKGGFNKVMFILDEFYIFKEAIQEVWLEMKAYNKELKGREHPCLSLWRRLVVLARTAGIHLVLGIQRPDAEFLTGLARDSFRMRVSLDRSTPETAMMMWGDRRMGTDLPNIQGRAVATTDDGPQYVQVNRLLTPEDGDDFNSEDHQVWANLVARMTTQAERYANGTDDLEFLGPLNTIESSDRQHIRDAVTAPLPPIEDVAQAADAAAARVASEELDEFEEVGAYDLETGDHILLDLDGSQLLVEVEDLHFGAEDDETEDDEDLIEVIYIDDAGKTDSVHLPVDELVSRKTPVSV